MDKNKNKIGLIKARLAELPAKNACPKKAKSLKPHALKARSLKAYTLIELIIVLAITVILLFIGIGGLLSGQKQFNYQANYERTLQLVRDARSLALNGKAFSDYTDYDRDGLKTEDGELMTPANVGVDFDTTAGVMTVTMFADLHKSDDDTAQNEGVYNPPDPFAFYTYTPGKDVALEQYTINNTLTLLLSGGARTIFFSPIFADVKFDPALTSGNKFFIFGVKETTGTRKGCAKIHPVAGVPEVASETECPST